MAKYIPVFILQAEGDFSGGTVEHFGNELFYFRTLREAKDFAQALYDYCAPKKRPRITAWKKDPNADVPCHVLVKTLDGSYKRYNSVWRIEEHDMREALQ